MGFSGPLYEREPEGHLGVAPDVFPEERELSGHENDEVIIHCRSGARSLQVAKLLRQNGFSKAKSMAGGILLWNKDVNPGGPQY